MNHTGLKYGNVYRDDARLYQLCSETTPYPTPSRVSSKNVEHPTAKEMDYGMDNKQLLIEVRAAMAGYLLRR
jgi:hypothetical protein